MEESLAFVNMRLHLKDRRSCQRQIQNELYWICRICRNRFQADLY